MTTIPPSIRTRVAAHISLIVIAILCCDGNKCAEAQTGANVLVVLNDMSAASDAIGRRYIRARAIPQDNVCAIHTAAAESIARDLYDAQIERPIWNCIARANAHDRILFIVLTKDVPIRIVGTGGRTGTSASVDSELTLLYRRATGTPVPVGGFVPNPYYAGAQPIASIRPFTHEAQDIYLVTRLDGYTTEDAMALIDRAAQPAREGRFILDARVSLIDSGGNGWLRTAAARLQAQGLGDRVVLDESAKVLTNESRVLGYYSWGSNDEAIRIRRFGLQFVPGALAGMFVSTDGRTFKEPPPAWNPGDGTNKAGVFGGSHQSLMADLIREGVTGAAGHVDEPYLDATIRPEILFPAYVSGRNLAEAYYAAMPYLSWQTIVVGDPLCAPFPRAALTVTDIDAGADPATELPASFSRRRVARVPATVNRAAAAAYVKAEARAARKDAAGGRQALEAAVAADTRFTAARLELASQDERDNRFDSANTHYRAILSYSPNEGVALNNLAYNLGVRGNRAAEALPLAERACTSTRNNPLFLDTLGWLQHLLKRDQEAAATMRLARSGGFQHPELLWHAAAIYAAVNDLPKALSELTLALKLQPDLAGQPEIKALQQRLNSGSK